jgi:hypothetical protein
VIEVVVYLVIVIALAGLGVRLGMILAGRIDRRLAPPDVDPPHAPTEEQS